MSAYRRKPVAVEAHQLIDDLRNHTKIATWITVNGGDVDVPFAEPCLYVETPEGRMRAEIGDWIVKGAKGEFRTCDPITFEATYEPATAQPAPEFAAAMADPDDGYLTPIDVLEQERDEARAELDQLRERLGRIEDSIGNVAAGLRLSASTSRPSKKSEIETSVANALLALLDPR